MGYKQDYQEIITKKNFTKLNKLMESGNLIADYKHSDFKIGNDSGINYLNVTIDTENEPSNYASFLMIIYLKRKELFNNSTEKEIFPLMIIVKPNKIDEMGEKYRSNETDFNHEFMHLKDLIEIFEQEPDFIYRGYNYALSNFTRTGKRKPDDIIKCIDYEVEKIFKIEPKAMKSDFEAGDKIIPIPFLFSLVEYECKDSTEYIKMKIFEYLKSLMSKLEEALNPDSELTKVINSGLERSINKFAKEVFGEEAYKNFNEFNSGWVKMILKYANNKMRDTKKY